MRKLRIIFNENRASIYFWITMEEKISVHRFSYRKEASSFKEVFKIISPEIRKGTSIYVAYSKLSRKFFIEPSYFSEEDFDSIYNIATQEITMRELISKIVASTLN